MPRKTTPCIAWIEWKKGASMRPRPDAAENAGSARSRRGRRGASMRPRPDAAENTPSRYASVNVASASMRPRPDAAENAPVQARLRA